MRSAPSIPSFSSSSIGSSRPSGGGSFSFSGLGSSSSASRPGSSFSSGSSSLGASSSSARSGSRPGSSSSLFSFNSPSLGSSSTSRLGSGSSSLFGSSSFGSSSSSRPSSSAYTFGSGSSRSTGNAFSLGSGSSSFGSGSSLFGSSSLGSSSASRSGSGSSYLFGSSSSRGSSLLSSPSSLSYGNSSNSGGISALQRRTGGVLAAGLPGLQQLGDAWNRNVAQPIQRATQPARDFIDRNVVQPIQRATQPARDYIDRNVVQPIQRATQPARDYIDRNVVQPVQRSLGIGGSSSPSSAPSRPTPPPSARLTIEPGTSIQVSRPAGQPVVVQAGGRTMTFAAGTSNSDLMRSGIVRGAVNLPAYRPAQPSSTRPATPSNPAQSAVRPNAPQQNWFQSSYGQVSRRMDRFFTGMQTNGNRLAEFGQVNGVPNPLTRDLNVAGEALDLLGGLGRGVGSAINGTPDWLNRTGRLISGQERFNPGDAAAATVSSVGKFGYGLVSGVGDLVTRVATPGGGHNVYDQTVNQGQQRITNWYEGQVRGLGVNPNSTTYRTVEQGLDVAGAIGQFFIPGGKGTPRGSAITRVSRVVDDGANIGSRARALPEAPSVTVPMRPGNTPGSYVPTGPIEFRPGTPRPTGNPTRTTTPPPTIDLVPQGGGRYAPVTPTTPSRPNATAPRTSGQPGGAPTPGRTPQPYSYPASQLSNGLDNVRPTQPARTTPTTGNTGQRPQLALPPARDGTLRPTNPTVSSPVQAPRVPNRATQPPRVQPTLPDATAPRNTSPNRAGLNGPTIDVAPSASRRAFQEVTPNDLGFPTRTARDGTTIVRESYTGPTAGLQRTAFRDNFRMRTVQPPGMNPYIQISDARSGRVLGEVPNARLETFRDQIVNGADRLTTPPPSTGRLSGTPLGNMLGRTERLQGATGQVTRLWSSLTQPRTPTSGAPSPLADNVRRWNEQNGPGTFGPQLSDPRTQIVVPSSRLPENRVPPWQQSAPSQRGTALPPGQTPRALPPSQTQPFVPPQRTPAEPLFTAPWLNTQPTQPFRVGPPSTPSGPTGPNRPNGQRGGGQPQPPGALVPYQGPRSNPLEARTIVESTGRLEPNPPAAPTTPRGGVRGTQSIGGSSGNTPASSPAPTVKIRPGRDDVSPQALLQRQTDSLRPSLARADNEGLRAARSGDVSNQRVQNALDQATGTTFTRTDRRFLAQETEAMAANFLRTVDSALNSHFSSKHLEPGAIGQASRLDQVNGLNGPSRPDSWFAPGPAGLVGDAVPRSTVFRSAMPIADNLAGAYDQARRLAQTAVNGQPVHVTVQLPKPTIVRDAVVTSAPGVNPPTVRFTERSVSQITFSFDQTNNGHLRPSTVVPGVPPYAATDPARYGTMPGR